MHNYFRSQGGGGVNYLLKAAGHDNGCVSGGEVIGREANSSGVRHCHCILLVWR